MSFNFTTLTNGIRIASEKMMGPESVALCFSFRAGARDEQESELGLAHLLEHMAFKGTKSHTAQEIAEAVDAIGGHMNAYTSMEYTVYYIHTLRDHMKTAFEMMADILCESIFDETEIEREKSVISQEIAMHHDTPEDLIFDYLHDAAWPGHPLSRNILGSEESVNTLQKADLVCYRERFYHAESMVISAAGNVDHEELVGLVEKSFLDYASSRERNEVAPVFMGGEKIVKREMLEQTQLMTARQGVSSQSEHYYALQLFSTLFGGGLSSRLFQEIREKRGLVYTVQSFLTTYSDSGLFGVYAGCAPEKCEELQRCLDNEIDRVLQEGVKDDEVQRAKQQQVSAVTMRAENVVSVAEWIARHIQEYGRYRSAQEMINHITYITKDEIYNAAAEILGQDKVALATLGP